jgi:glucosyl-dolichyl phosphate glucuronosyltransferase
MILLSVVIPTRNRARLLSDLLDSLVRQKPAPFEWEVIVVDNASTDQTATVARQKAQSSPVPIRYVLEPRLGLHQGRHRGAHEARGEYLAYFDDDTIVTPAWTDGVGLLKEGRADAVVGRILPKWEAKPPEWMLARTRSGVYGCLTLLDLGASPRPVEPSSVWGACFFVPRRLVFELGGFHPDGMPQELIRFRGDGETGFFQKFAAHGYRAWYDPHATVYHVIPPERMTVEFLCRRAYNQGISDSFTQIRAAHRTEASSTQTTKSDRLAERRGLARTLERIRGKSTAELWTAAKRRASRLGLRIGPLPQRLAAGHPDLPNPEIETRIRQAHDAGLRFHRESAQSDPELMAYVLRDSYLDDAGG